MDFEPQKDLNVPPDAHAVFRAAVIDYGFGLYEILPRDLQSPGMTFMVKRSPRHMPRAVLISPTFILIYFK